MAVTTAERRRAEVAPAERKPIRYYVDHIIRYVLLTLFALLFFAPFILAFLGTFKTNREITAWPPQILPELWRWENWERAWNVKIGAIENIFPRWIFNSLWLALGKTALQLFFSSLAAYSFARLRFRGKELIFSFMIASMAIPGAVTLIPGYVFYSKLGWVNTYLPLIIPTLTVAGGIFLLTQFFKSIPRELEEAAYIDGASRFRIYWNVILPMSKPALITFAILQFQAAWNDFIGPLLYLRRPQLMTLTVGLNYFKSQYRTDWSAILIGSMINAIPILIIFFLFSKYYTDTGASAAVKG
ncbi:MAG: sugar ABC transporter ATP-binding protein [Herpetosiphonaceae bacterium]|nr:MAG: sugar ABC transporter ATP-binding protein [Herpetosiphonaceae bacterium]